MHSDSRHALPHQSMQGLSQQTDALKTLFQPLTTVIPQQKQWLCYANSGAMGDCRKHENNVHTACTPATAHNVDTACTSATAHNVDNEYTPGTAHNVDTAFTPATAHNVDTAYTPATAHNVDTAYTPAAAHNVYTAYTPAKSSEASQTQQGNQCCQIMQN